MLTLIQLRTHPERGCRDLDPELSELFYADTQDEQQTAAAVYCSQCPIEMECRAWALATREPYGVWGGLTEQQRQALRDNRKSRVRCIMCRGDQLSGRDGVQICAGCGLSWRVRRTQNSPAPAAA